MTQAAAKSGARPPAGATLRVDMDSHIPALFVTLGGKIGLHAMRHHARGLGLDLREWRILQVLGGDGRSTIFGIADRIAMDRGGTSRSEPGNTIAPPSAQKSFIMSTTRTAVCGGDRVMLSSPCRWAEKLSMSVSRLEGIRRRPRAFRPSCRA